MKLSLVTLISTSLLTNKKTNSFHHPSRNVINTHKQRKTFSIKQPHRRSDIKSILEDDDILSEIKSKYYSTKQTQEKLKIIQEATEALQRTSNQLSSMTETPSKEKDEYNALYRKYLLESANSLKSRLLELKLKSNGKKNDLARRLAKYDMGYIKSGVVTKEEIDLIRDIEKFNEEGGSMKAVGDNSIRKFCDIPISERTSQLLANAGFIDTPTGVQKEAIPYIYNGNDCILHAETGSGKTLAYLLPIIEQVNQYSDDDEEICLILTPTRELSYQVASILMEFMTSTSSNMYVTLVTHPKNLMESNTRDYKLTKYGGRIQRKRGGGDIPTKRFVIGSASAIHSSLFGDDTCTSPATPKPLKNEFFKSVKWIVLDEVDRLLSIPKGRKDSVYKKHEKPAAVLTSNIIRFTFSKCQVVCASATVGRPLRRELCRVLGLSFSECPAIVRPADSTIDDDSDTTKESTAAITRAITIPDTIQHYVLPTNGSTSDDGTTTTSIGQLLTAAAFALKSLPNPQDRKILLVITREYCQNFSITQAVNALSYFKIQPTPQSLSNALENAVISGEIMDMESILSLQQQISRSVGLGQHENTQEQNTGYLYITNEDSIRGLHFSSLDLVVILGKPISPDEYIHIAGRTGRAGCKGCVLNIVSHAHAASLTSWETMLGGVRFIPVNDFEELKEIDF